LWSVYKFFASQSLHNIKNLKKKSGEAKDSAIFPFFILLHKRAKPIHLPYICVWRTNFAHACTANFCLHPHARRNFASSFSTGPQGGRPRCKCVWIIILVEKLCFAAEGFQPPRTFNSFALGFTCVCLGFSWRLPWLGGISTSLAVTGRDFNLLCLDLEGIFNLLAYLDLEGFQPPYFDLEGFQPPLL
jgi:hypothetical protein